jgi:hypothetical protein
MPRRAKTHAGIKVGLQDLHGALEANAADLAHVEGSRTKLALVLGEIEEVTLRQAVATVVKQEASQQLKRLLGEGQRLANLLRVAVKENYGPDAEKLSEFGLQPFRGRKRKAPQPVSPKAVHPTETAPAPVASADPHS